MKQNGGHIEVVKVLYTSGYNDSGGWARQLAGSRHMQKPYAMEDLGRTLRDLLTQ